MLVLMNHCLTYEEELMVAVALVQAYSALAFHNGDPYGGVEDARADGDASVEEVCDDGDNNVAVGDIPHCAYGNIHSCPFHIHQMDTG